MAPISQQAPAANTNANFGVRPTPSTSNCVEIAQILWSYSATPTGGNLTISWTDPVAGAVTETYYITAGGPGSITFNPPRRFPTGQIVTLTLAAGGASCAGTIYANAGQDVP
jgi:hypothetical protein